MTDTNGTALLVDGVHFLNGDVQRNGQRTPPSADDWERERARAGGQHAKPRTGEAPPHQLAIATAAAAVADDLVLDPSNPMPSAKQFLGLFYDHPEAPLLVESGNTLYRFNGRHHEAISEAEIRAKLYAWLETAKRVKPTSDGPKYLPFAPKRNKVADIIEALRAVVFTKSEPPAWIVGTGPDPRELVIAKNGIFHLQVNGNPVLIEPPTPRLFALNAVDFALLNPAPNPVKWLVFLHQLWPNLKDAQSIEALQMFFGYCLVMDTRQQKALMLVGPKRSGKGTICRILIRLLGAMAVCGPTLSGLSSNFGMWPLIGKMLAIISDARLTTTARLTGLDAGIIAADPTVRHSKI